MAAAATLAATTLEGQHYETALRLQALELALPELGRPNRTTISIDTEANSVTITTSLQITPTIANGAVTYAPVPYLA